MSIKMGFMCMWEPNHIEIQHYPRLGYLVQGYYKNQIVGTHV
jgi:hypothetical protein